MPAAQQFLSRFAGQSIRSSIRLRVAEPVPGRSNVLGGVARRLAAMVPLPAWEPTPGEMAMALEAAAA